MAASASLFSFRSAITTGIALVVCVAFFNVDETVTSGDFDKVIGSVAACCSIDFLSDISTDSVAERNNQSYLNIVH